MSARPLLLPRRPAAIAPQKPPERFEDLWTWRCFICGREGRCRHRELGVYQALLYVMEKRNGLQARPQAR